MISDTAAAAPWDGPPGSPRSGLLPDARTRGFVQYFLRAYPRRTALLVGLLVLAGLAEGVGILALLPVLEMATRTPDQGQTALSDAVERLLLGLNLQPSLAFLLALMVGAMAVKGLLRWLAMRQVGYTIAQVATDLRLRLLRALMRSSWRYLVGRPTGHFAAAINSEARRAAWSYKDACSAFADALQVGIYLGVVLFVSWQVALLAFAVAAGILFVLRRFVGMSRQSGQRQSEAMQSLMGRLTELLPNLKAFKAMARERHWSGLLEGDAERYNRAERRAVLAYETVTSLREPLFVLVMALGLYFTLEYAGMSFPVVLALAMLFYRIMFAIGEFQSKYQAMVVGESAFWLLMGQILEAEAAGEADRGSRAGVLPPLRDGIELRNISFAYDGHPVLNRASHRLPAGSFVAITGPSGAGKTTLIDLLCGLLQPDEGVILVDGTPLPEVGLTTWRGCIGYVSQHLLLLHDSILHNVTLGDASISPDEVRTALVAAGAWPFVAAHPDGMDRMIGERGARISGGQGQRIMIARALVHRPRLLILDEATTALDPAVEAEICTTLRDLRGDITIVAISHQPAMRAAADQVVEVSNGQLRSLPQLQPR